MSIHTAQFSLSATAAAISVPVNTVRTWFQRGRAALTGGLDKEPERDGLARMVSARTVLQLGITASLVKQGMTPAKAFMAAAGFAHIGDNDPISGKQRLPGKLWDGPCRSVLLVPRGDAFTPGQADVVRVVATDNFFAVVDRRGFNKTGGILLPLDDLVNAIRSRLGLGPDTNPDE